MLLRKSREMWWHSVISPMTNHRTNCAHSSCLTATGSFFLSLNEAYATSGFAWVHLFVQREEIRCCCCCCHFFRFVVCLYLSINSALTWKMVRNANVIGDLWWSDVKAFLYSFIARAWAQLHCSITFVQCVFIESRAEKKKRSLIFRTPWVRMQSNGLCRHLTS